MYKNDFLRKIYNMTPQQATDFEKFMQESTEENERIHKQIKDAFIEWDKEDQKWATDTDIENAIRRGIELERTGKVKEGFPEKDVDFIVKVSMEKLKDNR